MYRRIAAVFVVLSTLAFAGAAFRASAQTGQPPTGGPPPGAQGGPPPGMKPGGPGGPGGPGRMMGAPIDSFASDRDSLAQEVLDHIKGKENMAAESVFKNIKVFKGVPAGRLVQIMNKGWGRALGTNCQHCHVLGHWADEDKKTKQVARDMSAMVRSINDTLLARIPNLKSNRPDGKTNIGCFTCHHGQAHPS